MRLRATGFALALSLVGLCQAQTVPTHPNQVYAEVGGQPLMLDLYLPATGTTPRPLLVWIHGGGWSGGTRFPAPAHALRLRNFGVAVASISYRLSGQAGQWGSEPVIFPAQIHDTKAAIRWLRAHAAEFQIDPTRIGVWGSSAGGHLAALAGTSGNDPELEGTVGSDLGESSAVQVSVDYYGPVDVLAMQLDVTDPPGSMIDHDAPNSPESRLIGFNQPGQGIGVLRANASNPTPPFPQLMQRVTELNPQTWVDANEPPFMIVHGDADMSVPYAQSQRLLNTLQAFGHSPNVLTVVGAGHGGFPNSVHEAAQEFLLGELISPFFNNGFE